MERRAERRKKEEKKNSCEKKNNNHVLKLIGSSVILTRIHSKPIFNPSSFFVSFRIFCCLLADLLLSILCFSFLSVFVVVVFCFMLSRSTNQHRSSAVIIEWLVRGGHFSQKTKTKTKTQAIYFPLLLLLLTQKPHTPANTQLIDPVDPNKQLQNGAIELIDWFVSFIILNDM